MLPVKKKNTAKRSRQTLDSQDSPTSFQLSLDCLHRPCKVVVFNCASTLKGATTISSIKFESHKRYQPLWKKQNDKVLFSNFKLSRNNLTETEQSDLINTSSAKPTPSDDQRVVSTKRCLSQFTHRTTTTLLKHSQKNPAEMMKTLHCRNVEKDSMADVLQPFVKRSVVEDVFSSKALDALLDNEVDSLGESSSISRLADAQFDTSKIKYVTPASQSGYTKTLESVLKRKNQSTEIISLPENSHKGTLKRKLSKEINKKGFHPSLKRTFNLPKVRKCLDKQHNTQTFKQHKNYQDEYKRHSHEEKVNRLNVSPKIQLKTNNSLKKVNKILQKQSGLGSDKHIGTPLFHQKAKSIPQKKKCQEPFIQPVTATQAQFSLSALHILSRWNQLIKDNSSISTVSTDKDSLGLPDFSQHVLGFRHLRKRKQLSLAETPVQKIHKLTSSLRKPVVGIIKDLVKPLSGKFVTIISKELAEHSAGAVDDTANKHMKESVIQPLASPDKNNSFRKVEDLIMDLEEIELPHLGATFSQDETVDVVTVQDDFTMHNLLLNDSNKSSDVILSSNSVSYKENSESQKHRKVKFKRVRFKRKIPSKNSAGKICSKRLLRRYYLHRLNKKIRAFKSHCFANLPVTLARHKKVFTTTSVTLSKHKLRWNEIDLYGDKILLPEVFTVPSCLSCQFKPRKGTSLFGCTSARCREYSATPSTIKEGAGPVVVPPTEKRTPFPIYKFDTCSTATGISILRLIGSKKKDTRTVHVIKVVSLCDWSEAKENVLDTIIKSHHELRITQRGKYTCTSVDGFWLEVLRVPAHKALGRNITVQVKKALQVPPMQQISLVKVTKGGHKDSHNFSSAVMDMLEMDESQSAPFQSFLGIFALKDSDYKELEEEIAPEGSGSLPWYELEKLVSETMMETAPPKPTTKRFQLGKIGCLHPFSEKDDIDPKSSRQVKSGITEKDREKKIAAIKASSKMKDTNQTINANTTQVPPGRNELQGMMGPVNKFPSTHVASSPIVGVLGKDMQLALANATPVYHAGKRISVFSASQIVSTNHRIVKSIPKGNPPYCLNLPPNKLPQLPHNPNTKTTPNQPQTGKIINQQSGLSFRINKPGVMHPSANQHPNSSKIQLAKSKFIMKLSPKTTRMVKPPLVSGLSGNVINLSSKLPNQIRSDETQSGSTVLDNVKVIKVVNQNQAPQQSQPMETPDDPQKMTKVLLGPFQVINNNDGLMELLTNSSSLGTQLVSSAGMLVKPRSTNLPILPKPSMGNQNENDKKESHVSIAPKKPLASETTKIGRTSEPEITGKGQSNAPDTGEAETSEPERAGKGQISSPEKLIINNASTLSRSFDGKTLPDGQEFMVHNVSPKVEPPVSSGDESALFPKSAESNMHCHSEALDDSSECDASDNEQDSYSSNTLLPQSSKLSTASINESPPCPPMDIVKPTASCSREPSRTVGVSKINRSCQIRASQIEETKLAKSHSVLHFLLQELAENQNATETDPPLLANSSSQISEKQDEFIELVPSDDHNFNEALTIVSDDLTSQSGSGLGETDEFGKSEEDETETVEEYAHSDGQEEGLVDQDSSVEEIDICGEFDCSEVTRQLKKLSKTRSVPSMKPTLKKTRAEIIKEEFAILQTEPTSKSEDISEKLMKRVRMNSEKMRRALLKNGLLRLHAALKNQHAPVLHQVLLQAANECTCLTQEYEKNQTMLKRLRIRNVQLKKVLEIKMIEYGVTSPDTPLGAGEPYPPDPLSLSTSMEKNQQKPSRRKKQVFREIKEEMDPTSLIASAAEYLARIAE